MYIYGKLKNAYIILIISRVIIPILPFIAVIVAMSSCLPIAREDKGFWILLMLLALAARFLLSWILSKVNDWVLKKFADYCANGIVKTLFSDAYDQINIRIDQVISENDLQILFNKEKTDKSFTSYDDYSSFFTIEGLYKGRPFEFSNLSLLQNNGRRRKKKTFQGFCLLIELKQSEAFSLYDFEKRLNWESPYKNTGFYEKGNCYSVKENGKLYVGLDCCRGLFIPKYTRGYKVYIKQCTEDIALITRVLDAAIPN